MALQPIFEPCPPLYCGLLITHNYTHGMIPLDVWSARRRGLYLHRTTQHINKKTNIHALSGIRNCDPSKQETANLRLRPRSHRYRLHFKSSDPKCAHV
jgi:hypothetical protein